MSKRRKRVFILGLDGVSFDVLEHLGSRLPFINNVMRYGTRSVMVSTIPPWTPPAWTSIFTGVNPGKHGVFGFQKVIKGDDGFIVRPHHYGNVAVPFLHEALGFWGRKVVAVNVPLTYPARPRRLSRGNAVVVSDWSGPKITCNVNLPDDVMKVFRRALVPETGKDWSSKGSIEDKAIAFALAVKKLMDLIDWDVFIVVYPFTDWIMHDNPDFFKMEPSHVEGAVFYWADELLKEAYDKAGKVIVVSDHGFTLCPSMINVPYYLIKAGLGNPNMRNAINVGNIALNPGLVRLVKKVGFVRRVVRSLIRRVNKDRRVIPYKHFKAVMPDAGMIYVAPGYELKVREVLEGIDGVSVEEGKKLYWGRLTGLAPDFIVNPIPSYCVNIGEDAPASGENTGHAPHGVFMVYGEPRLTYPPFMRPWDVGVALFAESGIPIPSYCDVSSLAVDGLRRFNYAF